MSDGQSTDFKHEICVNRYGMYCIPATMRKREVCRIMLKGEVNEPRTLSFIRGLVSHGDVVSGGAFIGDFLPAIATAMGPDQTLYSFEPNPASFAAARETIRLNNLGNVELAPAAIGREEGTVSLVVTNEEGRALGGISKVVDTAIDGQTIDVKLTTLDALIDIDRHVSLIHLDVENFEWDALLGARETIKRCRPFIILEAGRPEKRARYLQNLVGTFPEAEYQLVGAMERNAFFRPNKPV